MDVVVDDMGVHHQIHHQDILVSDIHQYFQNLMLVILLHVFDEVVMIVVFEVFVAVRLH